MDMPSHEELRELEHIALVAYATRCAMRIRPFPFKGVDHDGNSEPIQLLIDRAIGFAYRWVKYLEAPMLDASMHVQLKLYELPYGSSFPPVATALDAMRAAGFDATIDRRGSTPQEINESLEELVDIVFQCSLTGHNSFFEEETTDAYDAACRKDYENLYKIGGLVDPRESGPLGPLWPNGIPAGYSLKENGGFLLDLETGEPISASKSKLTALGAFTTRAEREVELEVSPMDLPSDDDLGKLAPRARVAYAVRCAMRVRPLYRLSADHPHVRTYNAAIDNAISLALHYSAFSTSSATDAADAADAAANAARAAEAAFTDNAAAAAARATISAADAVSAAAYVDSYADDVNFDVDAVKPAAAAARAAVRAAAARPMPDDFDAVTAAAIHDYRNLVRLNPSSIDASDSGPLGPLWPNGEPLWYAKAKAEQQSTDVGQVIEASAESKLELGSSAAIELTPPPLKIYIDPGNAPQDLITELYTTLDALYRAQGGSGLQFTKDEQRSFSIEEAPL